MKARDLLQGVGFLAGETPALPLPDKLGALPAKRTSSPKAPATTQKMDGIDASTPKPATGVGKGSIFLIDAMSFIFRAYHAMARQRPMSTKTGIPTAATYVFVNMLNKLRKDFRPSTWPPSSTWPRRPSATSRPPPCRACASMTARAADFKKVAYSGYKAQPRRAMPADLAQQIPYIRRALEDLSHSDP